MRGTAASARRGLVAFAIVSVIVLGYFATEAYVVPATASSASLAASLRSATQLVAVAPDAASLYQTDCVPCHGAKGEGSDIAPSLNAAGSSALIEPKVTEGGGGMPVFSNLLTEQQIQAVSDYVAQNIADPTTHGATDGEGGDVWRLYCTPCHGSIGRGGALTSEYQRAQSGSGCRSRRAHRHARGTR